MFITLTNLYKNENIKSCTQSISKNLNFVIKISAF